MVKFEYAWGVPQADTFSCSPIREWVNKWLRESRKIVGSISVDPFARNSHLATYTNDLNPNTKAAWHMDAVAFLEMCRGSGKRFHLAIMDPPYSPRQISECYSEAGLKAGMKDTQNAALYARTREALAQVLEPNAIVLSFGWNSCGMGKKYRAEKLELLLVAHGGAHNDTICIAEQMPPADLFEDCHAT